MKYTYFIREKKSGLMKIGSSEQPQSRFQNLQVSSPRELEFILATTLVSESSCHQLFIESCIRGEWFLPSKEMDDFIEGLVKDSAKYPAQFWNYTKNDKAPILQTSCEVSATLDYPIQLSGMTREEISWLAAKSSQTGKSVDQLAIELIRAAAQRDGFIPKITTKNTTAA
jgi:hypothetical protein